MTFFPPIWIISKVLEPFVESGFESDVRDAGEEAVMDLGDAAFRVLPEFSKSRVKFMFCDDSRIDENGISALLYALPIDGVLYDFQMVFVKLHRALASKPLSTEKLVGALELGIPPKPFRSKLQTPGPVIHEVQMPDPMLGDEDLRLDVSVNMVNVLLDAWTANGLMEDVLEKQIVEAINEELKEHTPARVVDLVPRFPPMVSPDWELELGGLELNLKHGGDVASVVADGWAAMELRSNLPIMDSVKHSLRLGANPNGSGHSSIV